MELPKKLKKLLKQLLKRLRGVAKWTIVGKKSEGSSGAKRIWFAHNLEENALSQSEGEPNLTQRKKSRHRKWEGRLK